MTKICVEEGPKDLLVIEVLIEVIPASYELNYYKRTINIILLTDKLVLRASLCLFAVTSTWRLFQGIDEEILI